MKFETKNKITFFSFVYAIVIIFYHFNPGNYSIVVTGLFSKICNGLYNWSVRGGTFAVSFFYTMSAFLLYYNLTDENLTDKISRRVKSLLIPFFIWNVIYLLVFKTSDLKKPITAITGILASKYCGVLWFVEGLLLLLLFIKPLKWFINSQKKHVVVIILSLLISIFIIINAIGWRNIVPENSFTTYIDIWRFLNYIPSYLLGILFSAMGGVKLLEKKWSKLVLIICMVIFLIPILYVDMPTPMFKCFFPFHPICLWVLSDALFVWMKTFPSIMKETFLMYVLHGGIYRVMNKSLLKFHLLQFSLEYANGINAVYVVIFQIIEGTIVLAFCMIIIYLMRKFLPTPTRILSGNR